MEPADEVLVRRAVAHDPAAFATLVDRYYQRCLRFAWQQLGTREDGEEAVQDAFVRAYRALNKCKDPGRFRSWLMTILVNQCRSHGARQQRNRARLEDLRDWTSLEPLTTSPDDFVEIELKNALERLSPSLREAFLLKYVEDMSYEEISAVTGVRISALKMRVRRAAEALSKLLEVVDE